MKLGPILAWAAAVVAFVPANRAEAQFMYGMYGGSVRYGRGMSVAVGPFGGSAVSVRGPFGGRVTYAQGPFGGGAVGVRGPFGGGFTSYRPPLAPVLPIAPVVPVVPLAPVAPVPIAPQTVLNPAPAPLPYTPTYMTRIPQGLPTLAVGGTNYYYTPILPPGAQATTIGGLNYYVNGGVSYQPYFVGQRLVYLVVEL